MTYMGSRYPVWQDLLVKFQQMPLTGFSTYGVCGSADTQIIPSLQKP